MEASNLFMSAKQHIPTCWCYVIH